MTVIIAILLCFIVAFLIDFQIASLVLLGSISLFILIVIFKDGIDAEKGLYTGELYKANNHPISKSYASWARRVLADSNTIILDCETTGLGEQDEIIQLAIIDRNANVLFNSLIRPSKGKRISRKASDVHGITRETLQDAPMFEDVAEEIFKIIEGKKIVSYNAAFDCKLLLQTIKKSPNCYSGNHRTIKAQFDCAMKPYAEFIGEWVEWKKDYKWQKLPNADHTALGDCMATLAIIKKMAN